jgi:hypothetical protein
VCVVFQDVVGAIVTKDVLSSILAKEEQKLLANVLSRSLRTKPQNSTSWSNPKHKTQGRNSDSSRKSGSGLIPRRENHIVPTRRVLCEEGMQ